MIVTMIAMRMMKVAVHDVVNVVAVGNRRVTAVGAVLVGLVVGFASMAWCATRRIGRVHGKDVFFHIAAVLVVQMAVVEIIDVPFVQDAGVSAVGTVFVGMVFVMSRHD